MYNKLREKNKPNLGKGDRAVRFLLAIVLAAAVIFGLIKEWYMVFPLLVAIYLVLTANIAYCPLYGVFGWSTLKKENPG